MPSPQNSKLISVVKTLIDVIYGFLVVACVVLGLLIVLSSLILKGDIVLMASVPVAIGSGDEPQFDVQLDGSEAKGINAAFVDGAQGTMRLETSNWSFIAISNLAKLLTAIGLAYVFFLLRSVLQAILQGDPFSPESGARIRGIGYLVLLVGFLRPTVEYIAAKEILRQLTIVEPVLNLPSPFKVEVIFTSLLILTLAQVWSYGLELERDRALTI